MHVVFDVIDWVFSFALMVLTVWFLVIITPLINDIRKESQDPDITESWQDVRVSINLMYKGTKERLSEEITRRFKK